MITMNKLSFQAMIEAKQTLPSPSWMRLLHPDCSEMTDQAMMRLWMVQGNNKGIDPNPLFQNQYYANQLEDNGGIRRYPYLYQFIDESSACLRIGSSTKRPRIINPNPYFEADAIWSLYIKKRDFFSRCSQRIQNLVDPLTLYLRSPSWMQWKTAPHFSDYDYMSANIDVSSKRINAPLYHYLSTVYSEERPLFSANRTHRNPLFIAAGFNDFPLIANATYIIITCSESSITELSRALESTLVPDNTFVHVCVQAQILTWLNEETILALSRRNHRHIRYTIVECPSSFFSTWQDAIYYIPGLLTASRAKFISLPSAIDHRIRNKLSSKIVNIVESSCADTGSDTAIRLSFVQWSDIPSGLVAETNYLHKESISKFLHALENFAAPTSAVEAVTKASQYMQVNGMDLVHSKNVDLDMSYFEPSIKISGLNAGFDKSLHECKIFGPIEQVQAFNINRLQRAAFALPRNYNNKIRNTDKRSTLAIIHCFYIDIFQELISFLAPRSGLFYILVTTDCPTKKAAAEEILLKQQGFEYEIRVTPNRGRDVAPMLIEAVGLVDDYQFLLHLHTKKSPHSGALSGWRDYLVGNLIGEPEIIDNHLRLLSEDSSIGIIASPHFSTLIEESINWGHNWAEFRTLMDRVGISVSQVPPLDFPSSTMFWARIDALRPLFEAGLKYEDFAIEESQVDGTLAHAIERSLYFICESKGYQRILTSSLPAKLETDGNLILRSDSLLFDDYRILFSPPAVLYSNAADLSYWRGNNEVYFPPVRIEQNAARRFNILIPTVEPAHIYGGISTALKIAKELYEESRSSLNLRVIVTSAPITAAGYECLQNIFSAYPLSQSWPQAPSIYSAVDMCTLRKSPLALSANDIFFATAWWTADIAHKLLGIINKAFGFSHPLLYLIQDYESCFNSWSSKYVLCEATYRHRSSDTIALINSEELANFMTAYDFLAAYYLPFKINESIHSALVTKPRKKVVLVYARPSVARNLFDLILSGLEQWQLLHPFQAKEYCIAFVGEDFPRSVVDSIENCYLYGKLSLSGYASLLSEATVGISLMLSPHPSYPPLEMAYSGVHVITNTYTCKNLSHRSTNIHNIEDCDPSTIAESLSSLILRIEELSLSKPLGECESHFAIEPIEVTSAAERYNPSKIMNEILSRLRT